jgi:deoxyuridine 5'-triphosphate nucleotidohydrolase
MAEPVRIRLLTPTAQAPTRATAGSAGYDLYAAAAGVVPPACVDGTGRVLIGRALVSTGLALAIPPGYYGRVAPRSGLAVRHAIDVGAGVIDRDYRDELRVVLFNLGPDEFPIQVGDRIAQLIFERCGELEIALEDGLDQTARAGGFGSTGIQ